MKDYFNDNIEEIALYNQNIFFPFRAALHGENHPIYSTTHYHEYIEVIIVKFGTMNLYIDNNCYILNKGDMAFIGNNVIHSSDQNLSEKCNTYTIFYKSQLISNIEINTIDIDFTKYLIKFLPPYSYKIIKDNPKKNEFLNIMSEICYEFKNQQKGYEIYITNLIIQLIMKLYRHNLIEVPIIYNSDDQVNAIEKTISYIEENYNKNITMKELANYSNLSYYYYCKKFKEITGKCFKEYLNYIRLVEAEKLMIQNPDLAIKNVALNVGFTDQGSFYRLYKKIRGITPSNFIDKIKDNMIK